MKKVLLLFIFCAFMTGRASAQTAILQLDTAETVHIKFDTLQPKSRVFLSYSIVNVSTKAADSLVKGSRFYMNLRIKPDSAISRSRGKVIGDYMEPYFLKKHKIKVYDTIILADSIKTPPYGTNIIVIWPTGSGVHSTVLNNPRFFVVTYSDIEQVSAPKDIVNIYPNPANDIIHFEILNQQVQLQRTIIRDMAGREIMNRINKDSEMDISALPPGCYTLNLYFSDGSTGVYKLMKVH